MYWSGNSPVLSLVLAKTERERERGAALKSNKKHIFDQLLMIKKQTKILIIYFREGND